MKRLVADPTGAEGGGADLHPRPGAQVQGAFDGIPISAAYLDGCTGNISTLISMAKGLLCRSEHDDFEMAVFIHNRCRQRKTLEERIKLWHCFMKQRRFYPSFGSLPASQMRFPTSGVTLFYSRRR